MKKLLQNSQSVISALIGAGIAIVVMFAYLTLNPPGGRYTDDDIVRLADAQIEKITPAPPVEPAIYALVRPAVVQINRVNAGGTPTPGRGLGTGVVVDTNGSILTAYHVVADSDTVGIRFADGSTTTGTVTQRQPERDLAVVTVRRLPDGLTPAVLSGGVNTGDQVMAIGMPFGLDGSFSQGVVSGLGRSFVVEETGQVLQNMIQFDAAVNPGNSGGPLIDLNGHVVGIVSGLVNPTNDNVFIGIGFAVPIEAAGGIFAPLG